MAITVTVQHETRARLVESVGPMNYSDVSTMELEAPTFAQPYFSLSGQGSHMRIASGWRHGRMGAW